MFRETDVIRKKRRKCFVEQGINVVVNWSGWEAILNTFTY